MTDQDREYLRDIFACFAMQKITWKKGEEAQDAEDCFVIADAMMEARNAKVTTGLPPIKRRRKNE
jgi:hypothetical protein